MEDLLDANSVALYGMSPGMSFEEVLAQTNGVVGKEYYHPKRYGIISYALQPHLPHFDDENSCIKLHISYPKAVLLFRLRFALYTLL